MTTNDIDTTIRERLAAAFPADWARTNPDTLRMDGRVSFGYVGNVGVDRNGRYDDRSWRIFVRTDRFSDVGGYATDELPTMLADLDRLIPVVRRMLEAK